MYDESALHPRLDQRRAAARCSKASALVILVILVFLRDWRSTIVAMVAIPVSVIASFMVVAFFGASINVLTLLAIVLAIGIVVDDAIVEIENIHRRIEQRRAALARGLRRRARDRLRGHRHDRHADGGVRPARLHDRQYRAAVPRVRDPLAAAIFFSGVVARTLTPMMCSKLMVPAHGRIHR